jgi:hypothetical protein
MLAASVVRPGFLNPVIQCLGCLMGYYKQKLEERAVQVSCMAL